MLALAAAARAACAGDKADKLEIRLASSLLTAARPSDAIAASMPMFEMISREMSKPVPINFDIEPAHGMKEMVAFAESISKGKYQLGIVWGSEYGWLKQHRGDLGLRPLSVDYAADVPFDMLLLVADRSKNVKLAELKGKKLAQIVRPCLMAYFSLDNILRAENLDAKDFFAADSKRYPTQQAAVAALRDGDADCMITDVNSWYKLQSSQPGLAKHVVILRHGPVLPPAVAVGRPENLQKLRPGLWQEMETLLETAHETAEGKQCMRFWRIQRLQRPDKEFEDLVDRTSGQFNRFYEQVDVGEERTPAASPAASRAGASAPASLP